MNKMMHRVTGVMIFFGSKKNSFTFFWRLRFYPVNIAINFSQRCAGNFRFSISLSYVVLSSLPQIPLSFDFYMNKIYVLQKHADIDRKVLLHRIFLHAPETVGKTKERKTGGRKKNK